MRGARSPSRRPTTTRASSLRGYPTPRVDAARELGDDGAGMVLSLLACVREAPETLVPTRLEDAGDEVVQPAEPGPDIPLDEGDLEWAPEPAVLEAVGEA